MKPVAFASLTVWVAFFATACSANEPDPDAMKSAESAASRMAAGRESSAFPPRSEAGPAPSRTAAPTGPPVPSPVPDSQRQPVPTPTEVVAPNEGRVGSWWDFPWAAQDGLGCESPADSPGANLQPTDPSAVLIVGDSLIRDSRVEIAADLADRGFSPIFVCWGGKNLEWGEHQLLMARDLGLLTNCVVVNLGTNDLKGTTAAGLADAVPLEVVGQRLQSLLVSIADVADVLLVDIAANSDFAPETMGEVSMAPRVWVDSVAASGVGAVVSWSDQVSANMDLVNRTPGDGVHDTEEGKRVRAALIGDAVSRDCG